MATSAPSSLQNATFSGEPAVAITRAPTSTPSWTAADPTPPADAGLAGARPAPARRGMDEHGLAAEQSGPLAQTQPRQVERHVDGRRVRIRDARGHLERHHLGRHDLLRVPAERARRDRDDAPAHPLL